MKRWIKYTSFLFIVTILFALQTLDVNAQTIVPASGDQSGKTDYKNITGEMNRYCLPSMVSVSLQAMIPSFAGCK